MDQFISSITTQIHTILHEKKDELLKSWNENIEEAQNDEKDFPPLKVGIASSVDLEKSLVTSQVTFLTTYKTKLSEALPDPNQMDLNLSVGAKA